MLRQSNWVKRTVSVAVTIIVSYLILEAGSYVLYYGLYHQPFSFRAIENRRVSVNSSSSNKELLSKLDNIKTIFNASHEDVLHPYLGYVANDPLDPLWKQDGFYAEEDPFVATKNPDTVIVGISGASVAEFFFRKKKNRDALRGYLEKIPKFRGREITLAMFSTGAYHQPQQFFAVAYYLIQGGRLNLLINLDGKNEATYLTQLSRRNIYPAFPFFWDNFFIHDPTPDYLAQLGNIMMWKNIRRTSIRLFAHLNFSVSASTLWVTIDNLLEQQIRKSEAKLNKVQNNNENDYSLHGPDAGALKNAQKLLDLKEQLWVEGSLHLGYLAQADHFDYFHFLQPNQYVLNTKPLNKSELISAYEPQSDHQKTVQEAYPKFQADVGILRQKGINAYDLTHIYDNINKTIYIDKCCHTNDLGEDILVREIGQHIVDYNNQKPHIAEKIDTIGKY